MCVFVGETAVCLPNVMYIIISQSVTYVTILVWRSVASRPLYSVCQCWRNCYQSAKCYIGYHFSVSYLCYHFRLVIIGIEAHVLLFVCLFVLRLNVSVNNFSVMSGRSHRFLGN